MITPSMRPHADRMDKHHMNWRHKEWVHASATHRTVKEMGAYMLHLPRHWHDRLHVVLEPLDPPCVKVAETLAEIGREHNEWRDDSTRLDSMLTEMAGFAQVEVSPERADGMLEAMTSYAAQLAIYNTYRSMR